MQLTENVLTFKVIGASAGENYIDIARAMSIVGRKLYRQQGLWTVLGMKFYAEVNAGVPLIGGDGVNYQVAVSGAPRNWVTRNAMVKAFEHWKDQQALAYDAVSPSIKPKWQDFKVFLNKNHADEFAAGDELIPTSGHMFGGTDPYMAGPDWVHSKIVFQESDGLAPSTITTREPLLYILGDDSGNTHVGLIRAYQVSRARVISPDPDVPGAASTSIYSVSEEALSGKVEEITANLLDENDEPPYSVENYPGGASNGTEPLLYGFAANSTTAKRVLTLPGFSAPNGVIEVQWQAGETSDFWITMIVQGRSEY